MSLQPFDAAVFDSHQLVSDWSATTTEIPGSRKNCIFWIFMLIS
jgi:hypothetical protein